MRRERSLKTISGFFQVGKVLSGGNDEIVGDSVATNKDGSIIAVGDPNENSSTWDFRVFRWNENSSEFEQMGSDITNNVTSVSFISISDDGSKIAVGVPSNSSYLGHCRVYEFHEDLDSWSRMGQDIDGEIRSGNFGHSVSLSGNGIVLAIGSPLANDNFGSVNTYSFNGSNWVQLGAMIGGEQKGLLGYSISLDLNGTVIAVGGRRRPGPDVLVGAGQVQVYRFINDNWSPLGNRMSGLDYYDRFGLSVDITGDGKRIVVGSPFHDGGGYNNGKVEVFDFDSQLSQWVQFGQALTGEEKNDEFGGSVAITADGSRIVIGGVNNASYVSIFNYESLDGWSVVISDTGGERIMGVLGASVAISGDGQHIVVGEPQHLGVSGIYDGQVHVFQFGEFQVTTAPKKENAMVPSTQPRISLTGSSPSSSPTMFQKVSNEDTSERSFKEDEVDYYETNIKNENCTDSHHMFQVGIKEFTCNWAVHNKVNQCKKNAVAKNCPMTCGLCKPLKPYPNMPPSMSPEMPPTAVLHPNNTMSWHDDVSHEDENCTDRHSNFHVGTKEFTCKWAAQNKAKRCKKNAVSKNCPITCDLCKPEMFYYDV